MRLRLAGLVLLVVTVVAVAAVVDVPGIAELRHQYAGTGVLGALGFAAVFALLSLLPLPASVFTIAAGAVFGLARGLPIVVLGAVLGALGGFYLGRALGRDAVQHFTGTRLDALDELLRRRGFWAVLAVRLVPIVPFSAFNYLSGLTALRVRSYLAATALGILPATTAYVAVGAYGTRPGSLPFLSAVAGLVVLAVGSAIAARRQRRRRVRVTSDRDALG